MIVVAAAAMKMAAVTAEARTTATAATAVILTITHFVTRHVIANAIVHVVTIAIAFVSMQQRG